MSQSIMSLSVLHNLLWIDAFTEFKLKTAQLKRNHKSFDSSDLMTHTESWNKVSQIKLIMRHELSMFDLILSSNWQFEQIYGH